MVALFVQEAIQFFDVILLLSLPQMLNQPQQL
jgi:hypothetical protein